MAAPSRPATVPKNYPSPPASYPANAFRAQVEAAKRYLFESELKDVLQAANLPPEIATNPALIFEINVAQVACYMQGLKEVTGEAKAFEYGRDAFKKCSLLLARTTSTIPVLRAVSAMDKAFLRIRDTMAEYNRRFGANTLVKWHGGAESELFEDCGQHCYGYVAGAPICHSMTGFLQEAIASFSGVKVILEESDCMAKGALACRWHIKLAP